MLLACWQDYFPDFCSHRIFYISDSFPWEVLTWIYQSHLWFFNLCRFCALFLCASMYLLMWNEPWVYPHAVFNLFERINEDFLDQYLPGIIKNLLPIGCHFFSFTCTHESSYALHSFISKAQGNIFYFFYFYFISTCILLSLVASVDLYIYSLKEHHGKAVFSVLKTKLIIVGKNLY